MENKDAGIKEENISLVLDSYEDIFSDFDPRSYSEKALSHDFLQECKRAAMDKKEGIELRLMVPKVKRNPADEAKIKKRLKSHFQKHFNEKKREISMSRKAGLGWFFLGVVIMIFATLLYGHEGFLFNLFIIMAEPASWFFFWEGLDKAFIDIRDKRPDYEFYEKMADAETNFFDY